MKPIIKTRLFKFIIVFIILTCNLLGQQTESVTFKVTTTSPGGTYSPKNIGAIWIEDSDGNFVKTIKIWADRRSQYLYTWNNNTAGNKVDAITSATLSSHQTHEVTWNVENYLGEIVPNGIYQLKIEMTDKHAQGPIATFEFPVGEETNELSISDETYFHNMQLSWTSVITDLSNFEELPIEYELYENYPNPFNPITHIAVSIPESGSYTLKVYNVVGQEVATLLNDQIILGFHIFSFDATDLPSGIYFYNFSGANFTQTKKMLLLK